MNVIFSKIIYIYGCVFIVLLPFGKDIIQRKIIRDNSYDYVIYVSVNKSPKINDLKTYFWYRSGEIKNTTGGVGGDVLHKEYAKYYNNKQLAEQGHFYYGLKDGTWKSWHDNGTVEKVISYYKGIAQGDYYTYDSSGSIMTKGKYSRGRKVGTWITYSAINDTINYKRGEVIVKKEKDTLKPSFLKKASLWIQQKIHKKKDSLDSTIEKPKIEKNKRRKRKKASVPHLI